ncbi:MAG TPA: tellurite resistance/C4-dicarboxylate transporter family protein [Gaiellaceae bacterium]|nr:tellurite resistance/C4-dicarboxylate transporter family protein [Gaiellaceae bacterium]
MRREFRLVPAGSGAFVMGTGIVSVALALDGEDVVSRALFAIAAVGWLVSAAAALGRERLPASLTGVAATAVLGARAALLGWGRVAIVALALAVAMWLALLPDLVRTPRERAVGTSFLVVVATESIAVLAALVSQLEDTRWLATAAVAPLVLGLAAYPLVARRFDLRQIAFGHGDQWVAGGALAIAALACAEVGAAATGVLHTALDHAALVVWVLAIGWLPVLVAGELRGPRHGFDLRRWATVFPVGMYAVCSFLVAHVDGVDSIATFARIWAWVGLAVWLLAFAGAARRGVRPAAHYDPRR